MGITAIVRTLAATTGPTLTGILAGSDRFWIAFVAAGACRLVYDIGLYVLFINTKLYEHESGHSAAQASATSPQFSDEEDMTELEQLDHDHGKSKSKYEMDIRESPGTIRKFGRLIPQPNSGIRQRSPSPLARGHRGPS